MQAALTIGGSDSSCGAGIQADLKTFHACGVYGVCSVTSVTAQDGIRVRRIYPVPASMVSRQIDCVMAGAGVGAVKTGMLWSREIIMAVRGAVRKHRLRNLVVDPVLASHGGAPLLETRALEALVEKLFPLAGLVTPNLPEAEKFAGMEIKKEGDLREAARRIVNCGAGAVLIKGGHGQGRIMDLYYDGRRFLEFKSKRRCGTRLHGSGCILSAAIAAFLARGFSMPESVRSAKNYIERQFRKAWNIGGGNALARHV